MGKSRFCTPSYLDVVHAERTNVYWTLPLTLVPEPALAVALHGYLVMKSCSTCAS
jgi:hypothetical protein